MLALMSALLSFLESPDHARVAIDAAGNHLGGCALERIGAGQSIVAEIGHPELQFVVGLGEVGDLPPSLLSTGSSASNIVENGHVSRH
jgi:hypothetical protein